MPVAKGQIKRVVGGKKPIAAIFTAEQEEFLTDHGAPQDRFREPRRARAAAAQRWRFEDPGCPWPITAELWKRGDGKRLMEVSIKAPAVQAAAAVGGFMAFLAEVGAERDKDQQTKTRWALDYYVAKLARAPARKAPARKSSRQPARASSAAKPRRPAAKSR